MQVSPVDPDTQRVISIRQAFEAQVEDMKRKRVPLGAEDPPLDICYAYEMLGTKFSLEDWHVIYVLLAEHAPALRYFTTAFSKTSGWYRLGVFDFRFANLSAHAKRHTHILIPHPLVYPDCLEGFIAQLGREFFGHSTVRYVYEYESELRPPS